jgi:hypothetical protein
MMRHLFMTLGLLFALGCSYDDPTAEDGVVDTHPQAQRAHMLLASIGIEVEGQRLAGAHLAEVHIAVDGEHWGVFGFDADPPANWRFETDGQTLMRARIDEDLTLEGAEPDTVGGWAVYLGRSLAAGDHVVQLTRLVVRTSAGQEAEIRSDAWLPLRVELGDTSAWIGDLVFTLDALP